MASGVSKQFPQPTSRTLQSFPLREAGFIFQIQGWYELSLEGRFLYPREHSFRKAIFKGHFFLSSLLTHLKDIWGTSLVVQWLRLHSPKAGALGSIPG